MRNICIVSLVFSAISLACNDQQVRDKKEFPNRLLLTADKLKINEVIRPVNLAVHNDFLIIQNDDISEMPCFYVYSLDSLEYLYSFGRLGGSSEEFVSPLICTDDGSDLFRVFDQGTRSLKSYRITDKAALLKHNTKVEDPTGYPLQEAVMLNDSILMYLTVDNYVVSYNINAANTIDSIAFETGLQDLLGHSYNKTIDFFHFSAYKGRIVTGHNFIDRLSTDECSSDGTFKRGGVSLKDVRHQWYKDDLYENLYRYIYVYGTSNLVFAQYSGYEFKALQPFPINHGKRHFDFLMEVYDWDLNPKVLLEFDNDFLRCAIDERRKRIITWDFLKDFDFLLVYDYSGLSKYLSI